MAGRADKMDFFQRSTNVEISMYQTSEVEQFAPGHHGYPRAARNADLRTPAKSDHKRSLSIAGSAQSSRSSTLSPP